MDTTVILSDIHLGSPVCLAGPLLDFLEGLVACPPVRLILNGDVFDNQDFRRLCRLQWKVLGLLRKLSGDTEVIWIVGNHDGPLEAVAHLLGVTVLPEYVLHSGEKKFLVHHGHVHDHFITSHPILTWWADLVYWLAARVHRRFANLLKVTSKTYMRCVSLVRERAVAHALARGLDGAICGHTHLAAVSDDGRYANSGSWTEHPPTYLEVRRGEVFLRSAGQEEPTALRVVSDE